MRHLLEGEIAAVGRPARRVFKPHLASAGMPVAGWLAILGADALARGRSGCDSLLGLAEPPTAVISGIDLIAIGYVVEAHTRALAVPDDLSVVGIDDLDMSAHPVAAALDHPCPDRPRRNEMLCDLIKASAADPVIDLHGELVVRRSTSVMSALTDRKDLPVVSGQRRASSDALRQTTRSRPM